MTSLLAGAARLHPGGNIYWLRRGAQLPAVEAAGPGQSPATAHPDPEPVNFRLLQFCSDTDVHLDIGSRKGAYTALFYLLKVPTSVFTV